MSAPSPTVLAMRDDDLDPSQRAVLDVPVGASAVVLGAPGSGKTRTAIELIAHRVLEQGFDPGEVLLLAPRRTQAARLRDRLVVRLGVPVDGPPARTPASLAFDIARRAAIAEERPQPVLLAGGEQDALIAQLLESSDTPWPERLGPEVRALTAFRGELRDLFARAVEHGLVPEDLEELGHTHARPAWVAAARFWSEYYEVLTAVQPDAFDSAELAALAAAAVARGAGGGTAERLRLVVVDDLQDAGESTVQLLAALAARGVAVVAFGDPDVAADTFRGGEPDLLGRFESRLGLARAVRLRLRTVHRHPEAVRRFITTVTARIGTALAGPQRDARAAAAGGTPVIAVEAAGAGELALAIAHRLRDRHLEHGVPFADQAVVVRSGAQAEPLARALEAAGVPAITATTGMPVSSDRAARALLDVVATAIGVAPLDTRIRGRPAHRPVRRPRPAHPPAAAARPPRRGARRRRHPERRRAARRGARAAGAPRDHRVGLRRAAPPASPRRWRRCAGPRRRVDPRRSCSGSSGSAAGSPARGGSAPSPAAPVPRRPTATSTASSRSSPRPRGPPSAPRRIPRRSSSPRSCRRRCRTTRSRPAASATACSSRRPWGSPGSSSTRWCSPGCRTGCGRTSSPGDRCSAWATSCACSRRGRRPPGPRTSGAPRSPTSCGSWPSPRPAPAACSCSRPSRTRRRPRACSSRSRTST